MFKNQSFYLLDRAHAIKKGLKKEKLYDKNNVSCKQISTVTSTVTTTITITTITLTTTIIITTTITTTTITTTTTTTLKSVRNS